MSDDRDRIPPRGRLAALLRDIATDRTGRWTWLGEMLWYNGLAILLFSLLVVAWRAPWQLAWLVPVGGAMAAFGFHVRGLAPQAPPPPPTPKAGRKR